MKPWIFAWIIGHAVVAMVACVSPKTAVAIGLDLEQLACVIAQAELGASEPAAIAAVCSVPSGLIRDVASVLTARAKGRTMAAERLRAAGVTP